jgi:hypothetical protein
MSFTGLDGSGCPGRRGHHHFLNQPGLPQALRGHTLLPGCILGSHQFLRSQTRTMATQTNGRATARPMAPCQLWIRQRYLHKLVEAAAAEAGVVGGAREARGGRRGHSLAGGEEGEEDQACQIAASLRITP